MARLNRPVTRSERWYFASHSVLASEHTMASTPNYGGFKWLGHQDLTLSLVHNEKLDSGRSVGTMRLCVVRDLVADAWGEYELPAVGKLGM